MQVVPGVDDAGATGCTVQMLPRATASAQRSRNGSVDAEVNRAPYGEHRTAPSYDRPDPSPRQSAR